MSKIKYFCFVGLFSFLCQSFLCAQKDKKSFNPACLKSKFILPSGVYMCGHSLGPTSLSAKKKLKQTCDAWEKYGVACWNKEGWFDLSQKIATRISKIIGADPSTVAVSDSTSINIFKALMSALQLNKKRHTILALSDEFPTDLYIAQGIQAFCPHIKLRIVSRDSLESHFTEDVAVVILSHVNYKDSFMFDMKKITESAHKKGILIIWDLSHSIGIVPLSLKDIGVDFAVGCTYKYLNGGPGSPSFIYVSQKHHNTIKNPTSDWWGHEHPFDFDLQYHPKKGAAMYMVGTSTILGLQTLDGALDVFEDININELYNRRRVLSDKLIRFLSSLSNVGITVLSPRRALERGGHVAFQHRNGYAISRALISKGIICDCRGSVIRLCINSLYIDMADINKCINILSHIMKKKEYLEPRYQKRDQVT